MKLFNMKKIGLMLLGALVIGLSSCADEKTLAEPQTNPQEALMNADDLVVADELAASYNLPALVAQGTENIQIGTITECKNLPENYELVFHCEMGRDADFSRMAEVPVTISEDNALLVSVDDFEATYVSVMGKSAKTKTVYIRTWVAAVNGTNEAIFTKYYIVGEPAITPIDLGIELENAYYILVDQRKAHCIELAHSDASVDDDPTFSYLHDFTISETSSGWSWRIIPASTYDAAETMITDNNLPAVKDAIFGTPEGEENLLNGILKGLEVNADGDVTYSPAVGSLTVPGVYNFVVNMESQTYEFVPYYTLMYLPGSTSISDATGRIYSTDNNFYQGLVRLGAKFAFASSYDYAAATLYGPGASDGVMAPSSDLIATKAGFYYVSADMSALTYKMTLISDIALVGDLNNWGEDGKVELTKSSDYKTWSATVTFPADGTFKFRCNDAWDVNLGGTVDNLNFNGDNIAVEAGTYDVALNLGTLPYSVTMTKK